MNISQRKNAHLKKIKIKIKIKIKNLGQRDCVWEVLKRAMIQHPGPIHGAVDVGIERCSVVIRLARLD